MVAVIMLYQRSLDELRWEEFWRTIEKHWLKSEEGAAGSDKKKHLQHLDRSLIINGENDVTTAMMYIKILP